MKPFAILLITIFSYFQGFAQINWQEATRISDSLSIASEYEEALNYRKKAINLAKKEQPDTLDFLTVLKQITDSEVLMVNPDTRKETYDALKLKITELEAFNPKPEQLYQLYRRLYIYSYNYMRDFKAADFYVQQSIDTHFKSEKIDSVTLLNTIHAVGVVSRDLGNLSASIETFNEAIEFFGKLKKRDSSTLAIIYQDIAFAYHPNFLNIPQKRYEYLKKAEAVFNTIGEPNLDYYQATLAQLSDYERFYGNYDESLGYLNKGYQLYLDNKDATEASRMSKTGIKKELQYYHFKIMLYAKLEQEKEMLRAIKKIESYTKTNQLDALEYEFFVLSYLKTGRYYMKIKDFKKALFYFNKGITAAKSAT